MAISSEAAPRASSFPSIVSRPSEDVAPYREAQKAFITAYLDRLLRDCDGNVSVAAQRADVTRRSLYNMLERSGISPTAYREPASLARAPSLAAVQNALDKLRKLVAS